MSVAQHTKVAVATLLSASLYWSSPASAQTTQMVLMGFGEDDNGTSYILEWDSVRPATYRRDLELWRAWVMQNHENDRTFLHSVSRIRSYYDCNRRMTAVATVIEYDQSGAVQSSVELAAPQFRAPVSGSIEMRILEQVCRTEI